MKGSTFFAVANPLLGLWSKENNQQMKNKHLRMNGATRVMLLALLLCAAGMTKLQAQNITFADANVKTICVDNWDTDGDGELSYEEAAAVTDLGMVFRWNDDITSFNELQYFTGLSSIGRNAFNDCSNLISINIPNSVFYIRVCAFLDCTSLASIAFPNSLVCIDAYAFSNCSSLTSVIIPKNVTSLNYDSYHSSDPESLWGNPFCGCTSLEEIVVDPENSVFDSRNDCNAIIKGSTLITGCKNTVIPESVNEIGLEAFLSCSSLTSITIPNAVTTIGKNSFNGCTGLTFITIPTSVTSIGNYAFMDCTSLETVTLLSPSVTTLYSGSAFSNTSVDLVIYVPYEAIEDYKTAGNWSFYESKIKGWQQKSVTGYGEGNDKWAFIASPLTENLAPTAIENMIPSNDNYDLYRFNQSAAMEWENYKVHTQDFVLENGRGYLYASQEDVNIVFKGEFNEDDSKEVSLTYDAGKPLAGWNLVGNPFPVSAYADRSYYVMNTDGTGIDPTPVSVETAIEPCTGVMVKATATGQSVTFTKETRQTPNNGLLQIAVVRNERKGNVSEDKAIVSFNEGDALEKFVFNNESAQLYIPQGDGEYAIAYAEKQGELPLNFKVTKDGSYMLTINPEAVEMEYLHLIDNMTGADVDLLQTPQYTFAAKTTDYASRFKLVFSTNGPSTGSGTDGSETFAYYDGSEWVVSNEGEATLQVVDALGRIVSNKTINGNAMMSSEGLNAGVYVMRLMKGENVKTQKIVVR